MATTERLITAEQLATLPDNGRPTELVRGRIVEMNVPGPRHGQVCNKVSTIISVYANQHELGHVLVNDSGVITERDPDTVRGADVAFYRYEKVPKGPLPNRYLSTPPELVFEILSPGDRRAEILAKVAEYLKAGVSVVCVLDDHSKTVEVFSASYPVAKLAADDELTLPDILGGFRVAISQFFE